MADKNSKLAARVSAVNRANEYGRLVYGTLAAAFAPLVGQKVLKVDGSLLEKVNRQVPPLPGDAGVRVYRQSSSYNLVWTVQTWESVGGVAMYHDVSVYVGNLRGGVLESLHTPFNERTDYTVAEVEGQRAAYETARKAADEAKSALFPFGEYDR